MPLEVLMSEVTGDNNVPVHRLVQQRLDKADKMQWD